MLETTRDGTVWQRWLETVAEAGPRDGFEFASAATLLDPGQPLCVRFSSDAGVLMLPLLLRKVPGPRSELQDVVSPYDLGGFLFAPGSSVDVLMEAFAPAWAVWCSENNIVTEFLRLHPLRSWSAQLGNHSELHQEQVVVDLGDGYDRVAAGYTENTRRSVLKGRRAGVAAGRYPEADAAETFHPLYAASMRRLNAPLFYDFPLAFFERLFARVEGVELRTAAAGGVACAAAAVFLHDGPDVFYFLGASDPACLDSRPNHVLFDDAIRAFAGAGKRWLHLGGGSESLIRFKSGFSRRTVPYRVRRRVHDQGAYGELIANAKATGRIVTPGFFPAYRSHEFSPLGTS